MVSLRPLRHQIVYKWNHTHTTAYEFWFGAMCVRVCLCVYTLVIFQLLHHRRWYFILLNRAFFVFFPSSYNWQKSSVCRFLSRIHVSMLVCLCFVLFYFILWAHQRIPTRNERMRSWIVIINHLQTLGLAFEGSTTAYNII